MQIKFSLSRLPYLFFLFLPSAVHASLWSTWVSGMLVVSTFVTNPEASQICFKNREELKSAVNDYIVNGKRSNAAQAYGYPMNIWCVTGVTDMSGMFSDASAFNEDIGSWDVSLVTDMSGMFYGAYAFNQNIASWDVTSVTDMHYMFYGADAFNQDLGSWSVSQVKNMSGMFSHAYSFNQNISSWNVSQVKDMSGMFYHAESFNQDISGWNVAGVTDMRGMFYHAYAFKQDLCGWRSKIQSSTDVNYMFDYSGCPYEGDRALNSIISGPFCVKCTMTKSWLHKST